MGGRVNQLGHFQGWWPRRRLREEEDLIVKRLKKTDMTWTDFGGGGGWSVFVSCLVEYRCLIARCLFDSQWHGISMAF